jgi:pectate disaccharide-lyase
MLRYVLLASGVLLVMSMATMAVAETYYIAADAKPEGDGTTAKPWASLDVALAKVGGGNTFVFRPGIYRGPLQIPKQYAGTEASPTVIRSEVKWQAVVIGAPYHVISNGDNCDWVVVDGFEVCGARYDGIKMSGHHNTVRNCWAHNNSHMGIASHHRNDTVIENNLIEFNGQNIQFHHGIYASGERLIVRNNIIRHNAGFGAQLYPELKDSVVSGNVIYGQAVKHGIIVACPKGGGKNRIINNTVANNRGALTIWNGDGEVVMNNILVSSREVIQVDEATKNLVSDYNLCMPASERQGVHGLSADPMFVAPDRGVYWLKPGSPAIGKGTAEGAPAADFWARPMAKDKPRDLGALPFVPFLATAEARKGWDQNWAYRFAPGKEREIPDLWILPEEAGK